MRDKTPIDPGILAGLAALSFASFELDQFYALIKQAAPSDSNFESLAADLCPALHAQIIHPDLHSTAAALINRCLTKGISVTALGDPQYPAALTSIYRPPPLIFYRGELRRLGGVGDFLAIVGSRKGDSFGCGLARDFAAFASDGGACIVSGLAIGIDAAAHRGALQGGAELPTIAVLGSGLNNIYPRLNESLARAIIDRGGILLSQFLPDDVPYPVNFLNRNRVIAGLCRCTLVIQAPVRSGALSTAHYALEEGRDVLCVPGAINDPRYAGSNRLVKQGAEIVLCREDLAEFLPHARWKKDVPDAADSGKSPLEAEILAYLAERKKAHHDELLKLAEPVSVAAALLSLEMQGEIVRHPGNNLTIGVKVPPARGSG